MSTIRSLWRWLCGPSKAELFEETCNDMRELLYKNALEDKALIPGAIYTFDDKSQRFVTASDKPIGPRRWRRWRRRRRAA